MRSCSVEGCSNPHSCRGFCDMHYKRWKKHGDPSIALAGGRPREVLPGRRFGRLVVLGDHARDKRGQVIYLCSCDCGAQATVRVASLLNGNTRSCGCLNREKAAARSLTHGHSRSRGGLSTPTYKSWIAMRQRCTNPRHHKWAYYGGRGITVCDRWSSFEAFLADMGERPEGTTIDRINGDGNYEPGNCRWADPTTQSRNRVKFR